MSEHGNSAAQLVVRMAAMVAGYATFILSILITVEVICRKFFGFSFQGVDEYGGYVLAIGVSLSLSYALVMRAHTRVDVLINPLGRRLRAGFNVLAAAMMAALACFLCWQSVATLRETLEFDSRASTPLETPLWIPQLIWVAGFALFAVVALSYLIRGLRLAAGGQVDALNGLLGPKTTDEELNEALEDSQMTRLSGPVPDAHMEVKP
ncbi:TRAP transporter small permease subunit [Alcaligenes sp. SDU_A2]|uniref:TRAP transporter small permease subunit n=1 Tax=Alcaligenes sp. SDU_A2 TaxID=3136634 RepID=UPI00311E6140